MILTCPNCSARFLVDNNALGSAGRTVKCGNCGHTWHQQPQEREPVTPPEPEAADSAGTAGGAASAAAGAAPAAAQGSGKRGPKFRRPSWRAVALWGAILVVVGGLGGGAVAAREAIVATWPPAARFYALVGMPMPALGEGLSIQDTSLYRQQRGQNVALIMEGLVRNTSDKIKEVPTIRVNLLDGQKRRLNWQTVRAADKRLLPGETTTFKTRISDPHQAAVSAQVTFTRQRPALVFNPGMKKAKPKSALDGGGSGSGEGEG